jgi:FMN-dependent NADH-azoreductase
MKLLHIDASILGGNSISRQISAAVVDRLREEITDIEVTYRDLAAAPLPHLSGALFAAAQGALPGAAMVQEDLSTSQTVLEEFLAADIVVIGAPMYNFTIPSQLKSWIDRILVRGKTFRYTEHGPEGLAGDKRVIVAISRGGFYGADTPLAWAEHLETYLRTVFGFMGILKLEFIVAEGVGTGPERRKNAIEEALQVTANLRAA